MVDKLSGQARPDDASLHSTLLKLAQQWSTDPSSIEHLIPSLPQDLQPLWRPILMSKQLPSETDTQLQNAQKELTRLRDHLTSIHNEHTMEIADLQSIIEEERNERNQMDQLISVLREESKSLRDQLVHERQEEKMEGRALEEYEKVQASLENEKKVREELEAVLSSYEVCTL